MQTAEINALIADLKKNLEAIEGSSYPRLFVSHKVGSMPSKTVLEGWLAELGLKTADMMVFPHRRPDPVLAIGTPNYDDKGKEFPPARLPKGWFGIKSFDPMGKEIPDSANPLHMHPELNKQYATWIDHQVNNLRGK